MEGLAFGRSATPLTCPVVRNFQHTVVQVQVVRARSSEENARSTVGSEEVHVRRTNVVLSYVGNWQLRPQFFSIPISGAQPKLLASLISHLDSIALS